jgi:hypothetical protein
MLRAFGLVHEDTPLRACTSVLRALCIERAGLQESLGVFRRVGRNDCRWFLHAASAPGRQPVSANGRFGAAQLSVEGERSAITRHSGLPSPGPDSRGPMAT